MLISIYLNESNIQNKSLLIIKQAIYDRKPKAIKHTWEESSRMTGGEGVSSSIFT